MRIRALVLAVSVIACLAARGVQAQSASGAFTQGVQAYQQLELTSAGRLMRLALSVTGADSLSTEERGNALMYLYAVEILGTRRDSAAAVSQRLLAVNPRYEPDALVFPPEIVSALERRRRDVKIVVARFGDQPAFRPREETLHLTLVASSFHPIVVTVNREDGAPLVTLYDGPIDDSVDVTWNGLDGEGRDAPAGRYMAAISSRDTRGRALRTTRVPFDVLPARASIASRIAETAEPTPQVASAPGESRFGYSAGAGVGMHSGRSTTPAGELSLSGIGLAGDGAVSYGRLSLRVAYGEATLKSKEDPAATRTEAEGSAMVGFRTLPWLTLWFGPHARGWASDAGNQRWLMWEIRLESRFELIPDVLGFSVAGWSAAQGSVDASAPFERGIGAQGRIDYRLGRGPLMAAVSYRIEQARIKQGAQSESNNVLSFGLRLEPRR